VWIADLTGAAVFVLPSLPFDIQSWTFDVQLLVVVVDGALCANIAATPAGGLGRSRRIDAGIYGTSLAGRH
jgi:hypothetical protein